MAISREMELGWKAIGGIVHDKYNVTDRKKEQVVANICVDEVAFKRGHKYFISIIFMTERFDLRITHFS